MGTKIRPSLLERTLGATVHKLRMDRRQSLQDLASAAHVSVSMVSRIENGRASPSLATINSLANALGVPPAFLLGDQRRQSDVTFVKSGGGLSVERHGSGRSHTYQLLGHSPRAPVMFEPMLVTWPDKRLDQDLLIHEGFEFLYVLAGAFEYRVGERTFEMSVGDSLCFDATMRHGPTKVHKAPVKLISVITSASP